jgi:hypothetical protein
MIPGLCNEILLPWFACISFGMLAQTMQTENFFSVQRSKFKSKVESRKSKVEIDKRLVLLVAERRTTRSTEIR